jgi:hypothetical protein
MLVENDWNRFDRRSQGFRWMQVQNSTLMTYSCQPRCLHLLWLLPTLVRSTTVVDGAGCCMTWPLTLVGTIDLADTAWNTLVVGNFAVISK